MNYAVNCMASGKGMIQLSQRNAYGVDPQAEADCLCVIAYTFLISITQLFHKPCQSPRAESGTLVKN